MLAIVRFKHSTVVFLTFSLTCYAFLIFFHMIACLYLLRKGFVTVLVFNGCVSFVFIFISDLKKRLATNILSYPFIYRINFVFLNL